MNCKRQIDLQIIDLQSKIQSVIYHYINSGNILHCSSHELEEIRIDIDNNCNSLKHLTAIAYTLC